MVVREDVGSGIRKVETLVWATPREGLSLDDLITTMIGLGNRVLTVDRSHNRVKILHVVDRVQR